MGAVHSRQFYKIMTDIIPQPLTHVGPFPIAEVRRIVAYGFKKGWLVKSAALSIANSENVSDFQNRVMRADRQTKTPLTTDP